VSYTFSIFNKRKNNLQGGQVVESRAFCGFTNFRLEADAIKLKQ
jgi:hypothetical protein